MFGTVEDSCPDTAPTSNTAFWQLWSDGTVVATGASQPAGAVTSFYITNGFHSVAGTRYDSTTFTNIKLAEPLGSGGGCWQTENNTIGVGNCDGSDPQIFWVLYWFVDNTKLRTNNSSGRHYTLE